MGELDSSRLAWLATYQRESSGCPDHPGRVTRVECSESGRSWNTGQATAPRPDAVQDGFLLKIVFCYLVLETVTWRRSDPRGRWSGEGGELPRAGRGRRLQVVCLIAVISLNCSCTAGSLLPSGAGWRRWRYARSRWPRSSTPTPPSAPSSPSSILKAHLKKFRLLTLECRRIRARQPPFHPPGLLCD